MDQFTLYISYTKDSDYLYHFCDIVKRIPFLNNAKIIIDGWFNKEDEETLVKNIDWGALGIPFEKKMIHNISHGERCFELLEQADTDIVFIVDSDFFCLDERLWVDAYSKLISSPEIYLVSLYQDWNWIKDLPTTPFMAYRRKEVLDFVPEKMLWNHFRKIWPNLKQPVFDFMRFPFVSLYMSGHTHCIGAMNPATNLSYNHYHFWDSRHFPEENFKDFDKEITGSTAMFMVYGISKYLFKLIKSGQGTIPEFILNYMKYAKDSPYYFAYIKDFFNNFEKQILDPTWANNFKAIKNQFNTTFK